MYYDGLYVDCRYVVALQSSPAVLNSCLWILCFVTSTYVIRPTTTTTTIKKNGKEEYLH